MRKTSFVLFITFFFCGFSLFADSEFYLPQIADGAWEPTPFGVGGAMRTTFILVNPSDQESIVNIQLTGDDGAGMTVTIPELGTGDHFGPIVLGPGQTRIFQTKGEGAVRSGAARVVATRPIAVSATFRLIDKQAKGEIVRSEAGVGSSAALTGFVLPVHAGRAFNTALAVFAPGAQPVSLNLVLRDESGKEVGRKSQPLAAGGHVARFVAGSAGLFPEVDSDSPTRFQGTLEVTADRALAAIAIRELGFPLSYTTLPVVDKSSTEKQFYIAHVANGLESQNPYYSTRFLRTTFVIFNISSTPANVVLTLLKSDGSPFPITIFGSNQLPFTLPPRGSAFLETDGEGPLTVGSAQVTADVPIGVTGLYTLYYDQGRVATEAGIGTAPPRTAFTLPVEISPGFNTGVALFNPGDTAATVSARLLDENGERIETSEFSLPAENQKAVLVSELFPGLSGFKGSVAVTSSIAVSAVALRQIDNPVLYSALPVVEGVATGSQPPPLLERSEQSISATTDLVVNASLTSGFQVTGAISGDYSALRQATARSEEGQTYAGSIDATSRRYLVVVPAGRYRLEIRYQLPTESEETLVLRHATAAFDVAADVSRDFSVPTPLLYQFSGRIAGFSPLFLNPLIYLTNQDGTVSASVNLKADGTFRASVPRGSVVPFEKYRVSLAALGETGYSNQPEQLGFYNIASINLPATNDTLDLAMPPTIGFWVDAIFPRFSGYLPISAQFEDLSSESAAFGSLEEPRGSRVLNASLFHPLISKDRSYRLFLNFKLSQSGPGEVQFYKDLGLISAPQEPYTEEEIRIPLMPGLSTISGRVTDTNGHPLVGVKVRALSDQISEVPEAAFQEETTTDADGEYSLRVLSGTNYRLTFTPRLPEPPTS